jgi:hypothetical protein
MIDKSVQTPYMSFKIGWGILVFVAVGNILGHIGLLLFDPGGKTIFLTWAAFNFLAAAILLIPYRRGEKWAWIAIWGIVIPYALIILFNTEVGSIYLAEAGLMALGQALNYRVFFAKESG